MKYSPVKKGLVVTCLLLIIGLIFVPSLSADESSSGNTIYVDDDNTAGPWDGTLEHPYQHIQDAIDNASDGDTVFVCGGVYYEKILVNKSIILQGEGRNSTTIYWDKCSTVVDIKAHNGWPCNQQILIHGFTIFCSGESDSVPVVNIPRVNVRIINNTISSDGMIGIKLARVNNIIIKNNHISGGKVGIYVVEADRNIISYNHICNNTVGIKVGLNAPIPFAMENIVQYNAIYDNDLGITLVARFTKIKYNNFINNNRDATFYTFPDIWNHNYWNRPRFLPVPILGIVGFIPWLQFDWFPAKEPYDIP